MPILAVCGLHDISAIVEPDRRRSWVHHGPPVPTTIEIDTRAEAATWVARAGVEEHTLG